MLSGKPLQLTVDCSTDWVVCFVVLVWLATNRCRRCCSWRLPHANIRNVSVMEVHVGLGLYRCALTIAILSEKYFCYIVCFTHLLRRVASHRINCICFRTSGPSLSARRSVMRLTVSDTSSRRKRKPTGSFHVSASVKKPSRLAP